MEQLSEQIKDLGMQMTEIKSQIAENKKEMAKIAGLSMKTEKKVVDVKAELQETQ